MANMVIGRVLATEKNPTTIDNFTFWSIFRKIVEFSVKNDCFFDRKFDLV